MGDNTTISWTDATWNPIRGCRRISAGCENCYAERQAARFAGPGMPYDGLVKLTKSGPRWSGKTKVADNHLWDPFRWSKPRRIFTDSMSDLFYEGVYTHTIDKVVAMMILCCDHESRGGHVFQTLTKRPERMLEYLTDPKTLERVASWLGTNMEDGDAWYDQTVARPGGLLDPKIWWGVSVEDQDAAEARIPLLLQVPAAVRFLSCEPLLGPVNLGLPKTWLVGATARKILRDNGARGPVPQHLQPPPSIDWVIAGCESGPGARRCEVGWFRQLRDQCATAGVPYFLKQAEESADCGEDRHLDLGDDDSIAFDDGSKMKARRPGGNHIIELPYLDSVQHAAFPEVQP